MFGGGDEHRRCSKSAHSPSGLAGDGVDSFTSGTSAPGRLEGAEGGGGEGRRASFGDTEEASTHQWRPAAWRTALARVVERERLLKACSRTRLATSNPPPPPLGKSRSRRGFGLRHDRGEAPQAPFVGGGRRRRDAARPRAGGHRQPERASKSTRQRPSRSTGARRHTRARRRSLAAARPASRGRAVNRGSAFATGRVGCSPRSSLCRHGAAPRIRAASAARLRPKAKSAGSTDARAEGVQDQARWGEGDTLSNGGAVLNGSTRTSSTARHASARRWDAVMTGGRVDAAAPSDVDPVLVPTFFSDPSGLAWTSIKKKKGRRSGASTPLNYIKLGRDRRVRARPREHHQGVRPRSPTS